MCVCGGQNGTESARWVVLRELSLCHLGMGESGATAAAPEECEG